MQEREAALKAETDERRLRHCSGGSPERLRVRRGGAVVKDPIKRYEWFWGCRAGSPICGKCSGVGRLRTNPHPVTANCSREIGQ
jgi:hypothetical protein